MSTYAERRKICDQSAPLSSPEIASITIEITMLFIAITMAIVFLKSLSKLKKLNKMLRLLFISTITALFIYLISALSIPIICHQISEQISMIPMAIAILFYFITIINLLNTLLCRLYVTFNQSAYKIKNSGRYALNSLNTITMLLFAISIIMYISAIFLKPSTKKLIIEQRIAFAIYFAATGFSFYIITTAIIVYLFARNMLRLTRLRATSVIRVNSGSESPKAGTMGGMFAMEIQRKATELNEKQTKFINNISRYVSLFTFSLLSTFMTMLSPLIAEAFPSVFNGRFIYLILMVGSIDGTVNMACLALQYSFATEFYYKYCIWIECCWKRLFTVHMERALEKKYMEEIQLSELCVDSMSQKKGGNTPYVD